MLAISFPGVDLYPTKLGGVNWVHIFNASLVNSARVGLTRTVWAQNFPIDTTGQFGTNGNAKVRSPFRIKPTTATPIRESVAVSSAEAIRYTAAASSTTHTLTLTI